MFIVDLDDSDVRDGVEQERRAGGGAGGEAPPRPDSAPGRFLQSAPLPAPITPQSARVLLPEHEFHEGFPEDCCVALQE